MTIKDLQPSAIWGYFYEITQIPRPSKKEERIVAWLLDFAKEHNLEVKRPCWQRPHHKTGNQGEGACSYRYSTIACRHGLREECQCDTRFRQGSH